MFVVPIVLPQILADGPITVRTEAKGKTHCVTTTVTFYYTELIAATPIAAAAMSSLSSAQGNDSVIPRP
jgi:hypothetical protein